MFVLYGKGKLTKKLLIKCWRNELQKRIRGIYVGARSMDGLAFADIVAGGHSQNTVSLTIHAGQSSTEAAIKFFI